MKRFFPLGGLVLLPILLAACTGGGLYGNAPTATPVSTFAPNVSVPGDPATATPAAVAASVAVASDARLGDILINPEGRTLYYFVPERGGTIVCTGTCTNFWPPSLTATGSVSPITGTGVIGRLGVIARPGGAAKLSYNNWPLYTFSGDKAAGQVNGQGVVGFGGTWFVATPGLKA
jgi:predicted lipoprotein with Yx(FWY)xxD motif